MTDPRELTERDILIRLDTNVDRLLSDSKDHETRIRVLEDIAARLNVLFDSHEEVEKRVRDLEDSDTSRTSISDWWWRALVVLGGVAAVVFTHFYG